MESLNDSERRQGDRRRTVDLSWPREQERRAPGGSSRRQDEQEQAAWVRSVVPTPDAAFEAATAAANPSSPRSLAELEQDRADLQAAMDQRLARLADLPEAEFEAAQARDEELVTAWAVALRRVDREIAERRSAAS